MWEELEIVTVAGDVCSWFLYFDFEAYLEAHHNEALNVCLL